MQLIRNEQVTGSNPVVGSKVPSRQLALSFIGLLFIHLINASGIIEVDDANPSVATARALFYDRTARLYPINPDPSFYAPSPQGGYFSKMGLTYPGLFLPAIAVAGIVSHGASDIERFLVSLTNPVVCTLLLFLFLRICLSQGLSFHHALLFTAALGFTTYFFSYSKSTTREPFQALCLLLAYAPWTTRPHCTNLERSAWQTGFWGALAILTKQAALIPLLPVLMLIFLTKRSLLLRATVPILGALALWMIFAKYAWGSFFVTGYQSQVASLQGAPWSTPLFVGIFQQVFSWKTGIWVFSPSILLIPALYFWIIKKQEWRRFDSCVLLAFVFQAALYARWKSPLGGEVLGPRYLVAVLPLLFLPLIKIVVPLMQATALRRAAFVFLSTSFLWQCGLIAVKPQQYFTLKSYQPGESWRPQWWVMAKLFKEKVQGNPELYHSSDFGARQDKLIDLRGFETLQGFNFWWAHFRRLRST